MSTDDACLFDFVSGPCSATADGRWWDTAHYVVYADAATSGNSVTLASTSHASYSVSPCADVDSANNFSGC